MSIPVSDVHASTLASLCASACASRPPPLTPPVTRGGNGSWEIKALSCHNERLERWRDLSPMKREGQDRQRGRGGERERERGRESGERNNRGGRKMKIRGTQASPRRSLAVFSSMNSIKRTTDCHWQMLPPSSLSLSFPSAIVKTMDQGVNTGLSPLDGCAEIAITESKTKPVATQKPSLAFFIYLFFFLLCPSKQLPDSEKTNVGYLIFTFLCCYVMLCYVMLCYVMLCYVMFLWHFLGIHLTAKVPCEPL